MPNTLSLVLGVPKIPTLFKSQKFRLRLKEISYLGVPVKPKRTLHFQYTMAPGKPSCSKCKKQEDWKRQLNQSKTKHGRANINSHSSIASSQSACSQGFLNRQPRIPGITNIVRSSLQQNNIKSLIGIGLYPAIPTLKKWRQVKSRSSLATWRMQGQPGTQKNYSHICICQMYTRTNACTQTHTQMHAHNLQINWRAKCQKIQD